METTNQKRTAEESGNKMLTGLVSGSSVGSGRQKGLLAGTSLSEAKWIRSGDDLRLLVRAGDPVNVVISHCPVETAEQARAVEAKLAELQKPVDLSPLLQGGPPNYPQTLTSKIIRGKDEGPLRRRRVRTP